MAYFIVSVTALAAAFLAFFSGFGLGTLLLPAFIAFFPVQVAIAATAVVHLVNNVFRLALVGKYADWGIVLRFGLPAVLAAIPGAWLLGELSGLPVLYDYTLGSRTFETTPIKIAIGVIILGFAVFDLLPRLRKLSFQPKYLPVGGVLSGFFGGLSGNQGALRSMFLVKTGIESDVFIGTNSVIAVGVDLVRLIVYGASFYAGSFTAIDFGSWGLVGAAAGAAMIGSLIGSRFIKKITIDALRYVIGVLLVLVGLGLSAGLL